MVVWCNFNVNVEWKVENGKVRMKGAERSYYRESPCLIRLPNLER